MSNDKTPPGDEPFDLVDGSPYDQAITYSPMILTLRDMIQIVPESCAYLSVYLMKNNTFSIHMDKDLSTHSSNAANKAYEAITTGSYVMTIHRHRDFAEQLCKSGINFKRITDFSDLQKYLAEERLLAEEAEKENYKSGPSNLPDIIKNADGHIPRLSFTRNSKKINEFQNRCDTANISLIFNGGISTPFSKLTVSNQRLKIAAEYGILSEDYESYSDIPKNLNMEAEMFEYFLKTKSDIFVCYRNRWSNTVTSDQFNTASEAIVEIDQRIKARDFYLTMVLDATRSFADHIKGKYISINHLEMHPIIAPNALADRLRAAQKVERPEPFEWR